MNDTNCAIPHPETAGCNNACIQGCVCAVVSQCCEAWTEMCATIVSEDVYGCVEQCFQNISCLDNGHCKYSQTPSGEIASCDCPKNFKGAFCESSELFADIAEF